MEQYNLSSHFDESKKKKKKRIGESLILGCQGFFIPFQICADLHHTGGS